MAKIKYEKSRTKFELQEAKFEIVMGEFKFNSFQFLSSVLSVFQFILDMI